jgi:hypothetical protein
VWKNGGAIIEFHHQVITSSLGDNVHPWGTKFAPRSKLKMGLWSRFYKPIRLDISAGTFGRNFHKIGFIYLRLKKYLGYN